MSKGYVYIMTSSIDGLIKIGKSKDWNRRCQSELESNGYKNANGLKTYFVVETDDQDEIESIMHDIFRESRVSNFELFAVDKDRAKRVLSKMGRQVFPESTTINITDNKPLKCSFATLNIPVGSTLVCSKFGGLTVTTTDLENHVKLPTGEIVTITEAERTINPQASDGFYVFAYNGTTLRKMYRTLRGK